MSKKDLRPISVERAKNKLANALKRGKSKSHHNLHSNALKEIAALDKELERLTEAIADLEDEYSHADDTFRKRRNQQVKHHGRDSYFVQLTDTANEIFTERRLRAREVGTAIAGELDKTFKNFLNGKVTDEELKNAASIAADLFTLAAPLTLMLQVFEQLDSAIDRLEDERVASETYDLKVEIFSMIANGFAKLFYALRLRVERELSLY